MWDYVLGRYRINVRHAANELNWQIEDNSEDGLLLKRQVVRHFDKEDVRTYGLCFAVQTRPASSMFGSVIIRKQQRKNPNRLKSLDRFDILYTHDFNPNSNNLILFRNNVEKDHIGTYLVSLCKFFYEQQSRANISLLHTSKETTSIDTNKASSKIIYQCTHCFTVYDAQLGEPENNILAGTRFEELPSSYHCPLCNAGKEEFIATKESTLMLQE